MHDSDLELITHAAHVRALSDKACGSTLIWWKAWWKCGVRVSLLVAFRTKRARRLHCARFRLKWKACSLREYTAIKMLFLSTIDLLQMVNRSGWKWNAAKSNENQLIGIIRPTNFHPLSSMNWLAHCSFFFSLSLSPLGSHNLRVRTRKKLLILAFTSMFTAVSIVVDNNLPTKFLCVSAFSVAFCFPLFAARSRMICCFCLHYKCASGLTSSMCAPPSPSSAPPIHRRTHTHTHSASKLPSRAHPSSSSSPFYLFIFVKL